MKRIAFALCWLAVTGACHDNSSASDCGDGGRSFDGATGRHCAYIVVRGGFECPSHLPVITRLGEGATCSERGTVPEDVPPEACQFLGYAGCDAAREDVRFCEMGMTAQDFCDALLERNQVCGGMAVPDPSCVDDFLTRVDVVRPDFLCPIADCQINRPCGQSDDQCFLVGIAASVAAQDFFDDCQMTNDACPPGEGLSDDLCDADMYVDSAISEASACFELPCPDRESCLRGALRLPNDEES